MYIKCLLSILVIFLLIGCDNSGNPLSFDNAQIDSIVLERNHNHPNDGGAPPPPLDNKSSTVEGTDWDLNATWLGEITYMGNTKGYHLWFTPELSSGVYIAGDEFHNVYQYQVGDPEEWAGPIEVVNRAPYNIAGIAGNMVYYRIYNTTTDEMIVP